ncbi:S8 family peptidase [Parabacteroides sp. FAFU027]|uniref:S8 family peptidase n=1 Tax=Parabacteroides sp. FAFU027 TaxID=2922715 RepID=UPI001FAFCDB2|nr:S8 family serine peptidase [Parabacteroides sp. FAFU027]
MKVTVKVYLNVRVGRPSVNAPCFQYLAPGSVIEVEDKPYPGDKYEGIDTWYRDEAGNYYWSGGVENLIEKTKEVQPKIAGEYKNIKTIPYLLQIDKIWDKKEFGENASIAILDSGIALNCPDLLGAISSDIIGGNLNSKLRARNFVPNSISIDDDLGHGSHCAGLIASRNKENPIGIAPKSNLYVGKISDRNNSPSVNSMINGIAWAAGLVQGSPQNIDIISISNGSLLNIPDMIPIVNQALQKGKILVCSIGNRNLNGPIIGGYFPAIIDGVISVGAVDFNNVFQEFSYRNPKLTITCPGTNVLSYWINGDLNIESGTSQSTAICSGILALLVSKLKKEGEKNISAKINNALINSPLCYNDGYQYRIINPYILYQSI